MKNIGASVSEVLTQEKKEAEAGEIEEEEYHMMKNEMIFYLREYPNCQKLGWQSGVKTLKEI